MMSTRRPHNIIFLCVLVTFLSHRNNFYHAEEDSKKTSFFSTPLSVFCGLHEKKKILSTTTEEQEQQEQQEEKGKEKETSSSS